MIVYVNVLVVLGLTVLETVFHPISGRLSEKIEERNDIREKNNVKINSTRTYCKHSKPAQ